MKALVATSGRFHSFALARELLRRGALYKIVTGFPRFAIARENIPSRQVETTPAAVLLDLALKRTGLSNVKLGHRFLLETLRNVDRRARRFAGAADVFVALSGSGTITGSVMREQGKPFVCDRGSSHILYQQKLLNEEFDIQKAPRPFFDPRIVERELREYELSTTITVPSRFAEQSFRGYGIPASRLRRIPYGVNLVDFHPTTLPNPDTFEVLFVGSLSLRKGIPYLLRAFRAFKHPRKRLTLVGLRTPETTYFADTMQGPNIRVLGTVPHLRLKHIMSASHVLILPSLEEGLALVQAEALACGCPVIATENTGAEDLFDDGQEGFIVPIRSDRAIREKLEFLADNPDERQKLSIAARKRVASIGGWAQYGDRYFSLLNEISGHG